MYKERITKQQAYVAHLLDLFLETKEIYAFLEPMLFNKPVIEKYGQGKKARGFNAIKFSLFYACIQDLAKIYTDNDPKTPTVEKALTALADTPFRLALREEFSVWFMEHDPTLEPEVISLIKASEKKDEERRRQQFDKIYAETLALADDLSTAGEIAKFKTIRDKLTAHSELKKDGNEYKLLDIATLGVKWGAVGTTLEKLEKMVFNINLLIRNADFDFDGAGRNLQKAREAFWEA